MLRFFGGVYFSIILIALTLVFVIVGTFLESSSGSHEYAAHFTYHNPFFTLLLWLYFVNIFLSTLRRWPFKPKHIPFLITHAGLLMILAGVLIKNHFGVQGAMGLAEGSSSNTIFRPHTFALEVQTLERTHQIPLKAGQLGPLKAPLELTILSWKPTLQVEVLDKQILLPYDEHATGPHHPVLDGRYRLRFQCERQTIPFFVRLREAKQINYPGTERAYSYESSLLIDDKPATLSMNHVFEKKGYRLYLANIVTPESGAKWVQIVVNRDPAKYGLTYPGGIILAIGSLLLYLRKQYA